MINHKNRNINIIRRNPPRNFGVGPRAGRGTSEKISVFQALSLPPLTGKERTRGEVGVQMYIFLCNTDGVVVSLDLCLVIYDNQPIAEQCPAPQIRLLVCDLAHHDWQVQILTRTQLFCLGTRYQELCHIACSAFLFIPFASNL